MPPVATIQARDTYLTMCLTLQAVLGAVQVEPSEPELASVLAMAATSIDAQQRDPLKRYRDYVRQLNYGASYMLAPLRMHDLRRLDAAAACAHFSAAFRNPAEFTLCFVGALRDLLRIPMCNQSALVWLVCSPVFTMGRQRCRAALGALHPLAVRMSFANITCCRFLRLPPVADIVSCKAL
jgi:hypothetical protein